MRIQWRYQPCPCLLAGGLGSIWEAVSPLFSTSLVESIFQPDPSLFLVAPRR